MFLPAFIIIPLVFAFPLSSGQDLSGHCLGGFYGYETLVTCSYTGNSFYSDSVSISDNLPDDDENNSDFQGVTQEQFENFSQDVREYFEGVEAHRIEQETIFSKILNLIIYIAGFLLFFVLVELLRYIYKFFKMFF